MRTTDSIQTKAPLLGAWRPGERGCRNGLFFLTGIVRVFRNIPLGDLPKVQCPPHFVRENRGYESEVADSSQGMNPRIANMAPQSYPTP